MIPNAAPASVPTTPMTVPCTMKILVMVIGDAPRVLKIAISDFLSVTTITNDETMLNAATNTIRNKSKLTIAFSIWMALNKLPWVYVQLDA